jgi:predicted dehydrogenase
MWHSHAPGLVTQILNHPNEFRLVGGYDSDPHVVVKRREEWGPHVPGLRFFDRPEDLLHEPLDGVVVEGRVFENLALARLALEHGYPVMLEKPAGTDLDEFHHVQDLAARRHLRLQLIYLFRYMTATLDLIERCRRGELGAIYEYRARLPKDPREYDSYVRDLGRYRGGIFFEMAGHIIDLMVTLLGPPDSITPFLAHHRAHAGDFIDNGVAVFGYPNAWAILEVPALEVAPQTRRIEVYGTKGAFIIPHLGSGHLGNKAVQPVEFYRERDADWQRINHEAATLQIRDLREFAACLAGTKEPDYSPEHDLIVQETLLRACGMIVAPPAPDECP